MVEHIEFDMSKYRSDYILQFRPNPNIIISKGDIAYHKDINCITEKVKAFYHKVIKS